MGLRGPWLGDFLTPRHFVLAELSRYRSKLIRRAFRSRLAPIPSQPHHFQRLPSGQTPAEYHVLTTFFHQSGRTSRHLVCIMTGFP